LFTTSLPRTTYTRIATTTTRLATGITIQYPISTSLCALKPITSRNCSTVYVFTMPSAISMWFTESFSTAFITVLVSTDQFNEGMHTNRGGLYRWKIYALGIKWRLVDSGAMTRSPVRFVITNSL